MEIIKDFELKPFLRTVWLSQKARERWETAIQRIGQLVQELEIESVAAGQRPCAWRTVPRETLPDFVKANAEKGLFTLPVQWVGSWEGFVHYSPPGDSQAYCIVSRTLADALEFRSRFFKGDHDGQGEMLGFPPCCRSFFQERWANGIFDPLWDAWKNTGDEEPHPFSNPLLRYIGVRVGFHIPHSFRCEQTIQDGKDRLSLAKDQELVKLLSALLSMPMKWEAYHGIAVVKTPIFYVVTSTVPTAQKITVEIKGKFVPREASNAERFCYQT